jgi:hypothetical protein
MCFCDFYQCCEGTQFARWKTKTMGSSFCDPNLSWNHFVGIKIDYGISLLLDPKPKQEL